VDTSPTSLIVILWHSESRPVLWDEIAREHAEARSRVIEEPMHTWDVGVEGVAGSCSDVGRRC
jgi:hypothetical protein